VQSPLFTACDRGQWNMAKLLLSNKNCVLEKPYTKVYSKNAPDIAFEKGQIDILRIMVAHPNVKINEKLTDKFTPLELACHFDDVEMLESVLMHPDVDVNKGSILVQLSTKKNVQLLQMLLQHPDLDVNQGGALKIACDQAKRIPDCSKNVFELLKHPDIDTTGVEDNPEYEAVLDRARSFVTKRIKAAF